MSLIVKAGNCGTAFAVEFVLTMESDEMNFDFM
jgi:hypothetical protein